MTMNSGAPDGTPRGGSGYARGDAFIGYRTHVNERRARFIRVQHDDDGSVAGNRQGASLPVPARPHQTEANTKT